MSKDPIVKRCSYLCGPHLVRCDLDTNEHGGAHEGDCRCEKCPILVNKITIGTIYDTKEPIIVQEGTQNLESPPLGRGVRGPNYADSWKEPDNQVFDKQVIEDAINPNLPPCQSCESEEVLAVNRKDIQYAVMKCLICLHQRQLTQEEYQTAWPDSGALPLTKEVLEQEQGRHEPTDPKMLRKPL